MKRIDHLVKYMDFKGLNDNQVTKDCGLSVGLLGQARKGKSDLGDKTIEKILKTYQDLSRVFLLTGEGEMLKTNSHSEENKTVAIEERTERNSLKYYYELSATASNIENISDNELNQPYTLINFPGYEGCVGFNVAGESMYPTIRQRDIIALKPERVDLIVNGEIYLVVTRDGQRMVKRLCVLSETEEDGAVIKCISDNPNQELYAPFTIYGKDVHNIFRVKGTISASFFE